MCLSSSGNQNNRIILRCTKIRVCFKMQGDAISSGFACISRRFSAGLVGLSQGKSTQKCRQSRRNCASGILETHSNNIAKVLRTDIISITCTGFAGACGFPQRARLPARLGINTCQSGNSCRQARISAFPLFSRKILRFFATGSRIHA